ncbi:MAG TPA: hypothetical protein VGG35_18435 [Streptosporangiaceae bacterium]
MTSGELVIDRKFCGPPDSGNGGYVCGVVAACLDGPAQVTLRRPPPLDTPLTVRRDAGGSVRVEHQGRLVAEAIAVSASASTARAISVSANAARAVIVSPDGSAIVPDPVPVDAAREGSAGSWLRISPERHPFPSCFVCGPARPDGLRIAPGRVAGRDLSAGIWCPAPELAGPDGSMRPEFLWAALDCTGGIGAFGNDPDGPPYLLGRLAVRQVAPIQVGEPHVVTGWRLGREGRKMLAGSALFTAGGDLAGLGLATWIQLS